MRLISPGFFTGWIYPEAIIRIKTNDKLLCLTFDDGPDPESTPILLAILRKYNVKAVFFCRGDAAERYPELLSMITSEGHMTGNHGFNHFDGWRTATTDYIEDVKRADSSASTKLFRPPFGRMTLRQYRKLKKIYRIILWDIMPYDFDPRFGPDNSLSVLKKKMRPGSIIVLHDSLKSCAVRITEEFLDFAVGRGYKFIMPETGLLQRKVFRTSNQLF